MKIGIIGAGEIGKAFATRAAAAGYEIMISNSRGPESLREFASSLGDSVSAVDLNTAMSADVLFLSLPWQHIENVLKGYDFSGKIIIDPTNPILPGFVIAPLGGESSSEVLQKLIGDGKLVKAFNNLRPDVLGADPREKGGNRVIFYSGDHQDANDQVAEIISTIGFAGVGIGSLAVGGPLQQFPGSPFAGLNLIKLNS